VKNLTDLYKQKTPARTKSSVLKISEYRFVNFKPVIAANKWFLFHYL